MKSDCSRENIIYPYFIAAAAKNKADSYEASSGGMFYLIARNIIKAGGVVYGTVMDEPLSARCFRGTTLEDVEKMRKSKYIRSNIAGVYASVKSDLMKGYIVLFSGIACQINGLLVTLRDCDKTNLYTCEVVCHGMPLEASWKKYVAETEECENSSIKRLIFRDKRNGWLNNSISEEYENGTEIVQPSSKHPVHALYLKGINMEPGCKDCKFQRLPRIADITLADFWQADEEEWKESIFTGVSLLSVNNVKGDLLFNIIKRDCVSQPVPREVALQSCRHMSHAPFVHNSQSAFQKLINEYRFSQIAPLFTELGEIVLTEQLAVFSETDDRQIMLLFAKDISEIAYIVHNQIVQGIVTFGTFVDKYSKNEDYVNTDFARVEFGENSLVKIKEIFDNNIKINRIPIVDRYGKLLFEVRRWHCTNGQNDSKKYRLINAILNRSKIKCMFVHRPDIIDGYQYSYLQNERMESELSFSQMMQNVKKYRKHFVDILGEREDLEDYIAKLTQIPSIFNFGGRYRHAESPNNPLITVINGKRITAFTPAEYDYVIHIYGRCGVFGYAVDNKETIPSYIQKMLNEYGYKYLVENNGLWGADDRCIISNFINDFFDNKIIDNDVVLFYMYVNKDIIDEGKVIFTDECFHQALKCGANFYDKPGHMNSEGYCAVAKTIVETLRKRGLIDKNSILAKEAEKNALSVCSKELEDYLHKIEKIVPNNNSDVDIIGSIVMNCNPFTLGHQYLIDRASSIVDRLILFVVEEDKSCFPFAMRYQMVVEATRKYNNVYVVPSGKFVLSAMTFPEYFTKEFNPNVVITPSLDIELFGRYIAPYFRITKRFVGTEPNDMVTYQYNQIMKAELHKYGIELVEFERIRENDSESIISATKVREKIKNQDRSIKNLVPKTTYQILESAGII